VIDAGIVRLNADEERMVITEADIESLSHEELDALQSIAAGVAHPDVAMLEEFGPFGVRWTIRKRPRVPVITTAPLPSQ
jgi:hypothetical protein